METLNQKLRKNNQKSIITFYSSEPKKIILNNKEYLGKDATKIIRRINGDNIWMEYFDKIYLLEEDNAEKKAKSAISSKGGKSCQAKYGEKIKKNLNTGIPWNKNTKGMYPYSSWCKGLTKNSDQRLANLSEIRKGTGNPMHGVKMSDEDKAFRSMLMKEKILEGSFTPNSNNRNTHWESSFKNKLFRSSWEAIYYSINPFDLYESLRIKYNYEGTEHIYIVDFINHTNKTVTEIKPLCFLKDTKTNVKIQALKDWATLNGYSVNIITENNIFNGFDISNLLYFDKNTQLKVKCNYETYLKKRNR